MIHKGIKCGSSGRCDDARYPAWSLLSTERSSSNAFIAVSFLAGTYSYARTDVASAHAHSHHTRPARPSFEP